MPLFDYIEKENASEDIAKLYQRFMDKFEMKELPNLVKAMGNAKNFLNDVYMNLDKALNKSKLEPKTAQALVIAVSAANNCRYCLNRHTQIALKSGFTQEEVCDILGIVSSCITFNEYYKIRGLAPNPEFENYKPGLRAHSFIKSDWDAKVVELISVLVSSIKGCKSCVTGHLEAAKQAGATMQEIDDALRLCGVISGINAFANAFGIED